MQVILKREPRNTRLKEYIAYYYFIESADNERTDFVYYPHYISALNIFFNAEVALSDDVFKVECSEIGKSTAVVSADRSYFRHAQLIGPYNIVGIVFRPLGLFNFLDPKTNEDYKNKEFILEPTSILGKEINLMNFLEQKEDDKKVEELDEMMMRNFYSFEKPKLTSMLNAIIKSEGKMQIQELEDKFEVSRRTILRWFQNYLNFTPTEMKNIVKFRLAIDKFQLDNKLSALSYESNYYDQSDFIKHFKVLTGELPKNLLNQVKRQKNQAFFWKMIDI